MDDLELLQAYVDRQDQEAFAQLVQRHGTWLYSAARRQLGDGHLAEDAAQAVLLLLARRARPLRRHSYLSGWLFVTMGYCVREMKRERRRMARREQEAAMMRPEKIEPEVTWEAISPLLEEAVGQLGRQERDAVLLRFYEQRPLAEVGECLGISEKAAQKRVERAVGKLREKLAGKGVEVEAGSLGAMVLAHAVEGMEGGASGLVEKVMAGIGGGITNGTAGLIAKGAEKMMVWAKVKVAAVVMLVVLVAGVGAGLAGMGGGSASTQPSAVALTTISATKPAAISSDDKADIAKLLALRAALLSNSDQGRGTGITASTRVYAQGETETAASQSVDFAFSGRKSIRWEKERESGKLAKSFLDMEDKQVRHITGLGGVPASVTIEAVPLRSIGGAPLYTWTYAELGRLPWNLKDVPEDKAMDLLLSRTAVSVKHEGDTIRLIGVVGNERKPPGCRDYRATVTTVFDLKLGGMITESVERRESVMDDGGKEIWEQRLSIDWVSEENRVVPRKWRSSGSSHDVDGSKQEHEYMIDFKEFRFQPVPPAEFTIGNLGIRTGTPVVDQVAGSEYPYIADTGAMKGAKAANSDVGR